MSWMLAIALSLGPAFAVDFSGSWELDEEASETLDPVFELHGLPWAMRKIVEGFDNKQVVAQTKTGMTVTFDNFAGHAVQEFHFDGVAHETVSPAKRAQTFTTTWQGEVLVATGPVSSPTGTEGWITERRSMSADGVMILEITMQVGDEVAVVKRVFRRARP